MMRSLFSGVSGLRSYQTGMDVIGANISNINTPGYKGSQTTYSDIMSQTMQGAGASTGNRGGTNPIQIGMGVGLSAVDTIMTNGSYQPTGKQTDLAIDKEGFFIVSDGLTQYYTRAGGFAFDAAGNFGIPSTGLKVMGWVGVDGVVDTSGQVQAITIPTGITLPAVATTKVTFINNLSADDARGTSAQTSKDVYDSLGKTHTLKDKFVKIDDVNNVWLSKASLADGTSVSNALTELTFDKAGAISAIKQVTPNATWPSTTIKLKDGLQLDTTAGSKHYSNTFTLFDATGSAKDYVAEFTNATGLAHSATMNIYAASDTTHSTVLGTTTVNEASGVYTISGFTFTAGTPLYAIAASTVSGSVMAADKFIGEVVPAATTSLTIPSLQLDNTSGSVQDAYYTVFDADLTPHVLKMEFTQTADKTWNYKLTESGVTNATALLSGTVNFTAGVAPAPGTYTFTPKLAASAFDVGTGSAKTSIKFVEPATFVDPAGSSFDAACMATYGTSSSVNPVEFTPTGANKVSVTMDVSAVTQTAGKTTVSAQEQNGNAAGSLDGVTVDTSGVIIGNFSNGKTLNLAQVALATFTNSGGLARVGNTLFAYSNNSGTPSIGPSGTGGRGTIKPGTLEMSNVDLADQFSKMITTQRGFQANSKIISVSDEMLEILATLKR